MTVIVTGRYSCSPEVYDSEQRYELVFVCTNSHSPLYLRQSLAREKIVVNDMMRKWLLTIPKLKEVSSNFCKTEPFLP